MIRKADLLEAVDLLTVEHYRLVARVNELEKKINGNVNKHTKCSLGIPKNEEKRLEKAIKAVTKTEKKKPGRPRKVNK